MKMDIGNFDRQEAVAVFKEALDKAKIIYHGRNTTYVKRLSVLMEENNSIIAYANLEPIGEGSHDLEYFVESINEILAQKTYTYPPTDNNGEIGEKSLWPVLLANSGNKDILYSFGHPCDKGSSTTYKFPTGVCSLNKGSIDSQNTNKQKYTIGPLPPEYTRFLFLANDSEHCFLSTGGLNRIWTQYFYYYSEKQTHQYKPEEKLLEIWVGIPVEKGRATGSLGAGRCDNVNEVDYFWMGNYQLGVALGLHSSPYMYIQTPINELWTIDSYVNGMCIFLKEKGFHLTNFPEGSEILYFKKFTTENGEGRKNRPKERNPHRPLSSARNFKEDFHIVRQFEFAARKKIKRRQIQPNPSDRKSAASEMKKQLEVFDQGYNQFELSSFFSNGSAKSFARAIKNHSDGKILDIDQEWCHLFGHGDGGSEEPSNFISGSKHCNSEQLAIEEGQRIWAQRESKKKTSLQANITTYADPVSVKDEKLALVFEALLTQKRPRKTAVDFIAEDEKEIVKGLLIYSLLTKQDLKEKEGVIAALKRSKFRRFLEMIKPFFRRNHTLAFSSNFLEGYQSLRNSIDKSLRDSNYNDVSSLWRETLGTLENSYLRNFYPRYMRYKIKLKTGRSWVKVFDHVYDAQSESFDYHEFKILRTTVDRLIAEALGETDEYKERIKKKSAYYEIGNIRFYRDANGGVKVVDPNAMDVENG